MGFRWHVHVGWELLQIVHSTRKLIHICRDEKTVDLQVPGNGFIKVCGRTFVLIVISDRA